MLDLDWPYKRHADVFAGTQRYAQEQGWESVIDEYADDTLPASVTRTIPYDGIIARATQKLARRACGLKVPVVNVWLSSPVWRMLPGVFADHHAIGRLRAEHLQARGLRRFAGLLRCNERALEQEMKAFSGKLAESGYACSVEKIPDATSSLQHWRKAERAIAAWMDCWKLPIGVYVGGETEGRIVAQMCRNRGWRIPDDVAIITGWNEETICEHLRPTLTSVEVGYQRIGYEAARLLDQLMSGLKAPAKPILIPPQSVVVRESTDFFAVDDPLIAAALQFIAAKSHLDIGAGDVAQAVNTQTRTLQRRFRKYLDRPIATEIRRVRIERAKRELAQEQTILERDCTRRRLRRGDADVRGFPAGVGCHAEPVPI
ncbi:MAG TPA: substrate-binding domain-containing protein [Planctomycetota bacterium]